jgi:hypothetical protein
MMVDFKTSRYLAFAALCAFGLGAGAAQAVTLQITVTNEQTSGGLSLTPFLTVFHDGSFDAFDAGGMASPALEAIAEEGDVSVALSGLGGETTAVVAAPGGFPGAPVIEPGETGTVLVDVDPFSDLYLSFLAMVIPSNDLFLGNPDPLAYQLFDGAGMFLNIADILVGPSGVWDAGTEQNNNQGAAFNTGGGTATDTLEGIALAGDLGYLVGQGTPIGPVTGIGDGLARISIAVVPLPATLPMAIAAVGLLGWVGRRRKLA